MKKNKLFGANIDPHCSYCEYSVFDGDNVSCVVKRNIKNGKCKKFSYNPTLRIPKKANPLPVYDESDFLL